MDTVLDRAVAEERIVGATVIVAKGGEVAYARSVGWRDREARTAMTDDTIYRLSSLTKPIVTAAVMRLVQDGALDLDEPVTDRLPGLRPALPDGSRPVIRLHHLLTHTSGLRYRFFDPVGTGYDAADVSDGLDQPGLTWAENERRLVSVPLGFAPGTSWQYSLGLDVAGEVAAAATGEPLPRVVRRTVTGPLGMTDTGFTAADPARVAVPYADGSPRPVRMGAEHDVPGVAGARTRFAPGRLFDPDSYPSGGAGMAGTASDMLTFLETMRTGGGDVLRPDTVAQMRRTRVGAEAATDGPGWGFGLGWAVLIDPAAAGTPQRAGTLQWAGAYGNRWFVDPVSELTMVALTNTTMEGIFGDFTRETRDAAYTV